MLAIPSNQLSVATSLPGLAPASPFIYSPHFHPFSTGKEIKHLSILEKALATYDDKPVTDLGRFVLKTIPDLACSFYRTMTSLWNTNVAKKSEEDRTSQQFKKDRMERSSKKIETMTVVQNVQSKDESFDTYQNNYYPHISKDIPYWTGSKSFSCSFNGTNYIQAWKLLSFDKDGGPQGYPTGFSDCFPKCSLRNLLDPYFEIIAALPAAQTCTLKPYYLSNLRYGSPRHSSEYYDGYSYNVYVEPNQKLEEYQGLFFEGQTDLPLWDMKIVDQCNRECRVKNKNPQPDPIIMFDPKSPNRISGSNSIAYLSRYCVESFSLQTWNLDLPAVDGIFFPFHRSFIKEFRECSVDEVQNYFAHVGSNTVCEDPLSNLTELFANVLNTGSFAIFSSEGILSVEFNKPFSSEAIQKCLDSSYEHYTHKKYQIIKVLAVATNALLIVGAVFSYQRIKMNRQKADLHSAQKFLDEKVIRATKPYDL